VDFAAGNLSTPSTSDFQVRRALQLGKGPTHLLEKLGGAICSFFEVYGEGAYTTRPRP
jgi:hypothetical protein